MSNSIRAVPHWPNWIIRALFNFDVSAISATIFLEIIMNKDQVNGRIKEVIGNVKEVAGKITDNKNLEVKGNIQKNIGKAQADFGDLKNNLKKWLLLKRI